MMKLLSQLSKDDLAGKKVFLRVDFNVAVTDNKITEPFKIEEAKPTIMYLLDKGAEVTLASHIESVKSFDPIREQIMQILGRQIPLLENTRANAGEKEDNEAFAQELAKGHDLYVNDAFAAAHRAHASVHAITKLLPSYAGLLMERETNELSKALSTSTEGKVVVLGGAKIETKMPVIQNFLDKADHILLGGALINQRAELAAIAHPKIIIPKDTNPPEGNAFDIGPQTIRAYQDILAKAKFVVWNGPVGKYEDAAYVPGTRAIAEAVSKVPFSLIGGGDTVAAVDVFGLRDKYSYVSTGGGAMLEFLSGKQLPALIALDYYG